MNSTCPSENLLRDFHFGLLTELQLRDLEGHLSNCRQCEEVLSQMDDTIDGITDALRQSPPRGQSTEPNSWPTIPGFEILGVAGRGGMGVVYQAKQLGLNRIVAIKTIDAHYSAERGFAARLLREAEAVASLRHPNIVQIYEVGMHSGLPFIVLEWMDGGKLGDLLAASPPTPRSATQLMAAMARAVHFAHEHGIVHRDLKPGNILLSDDRTVQKISDFGLARRLDGDQRLTVSGMIAGSPSYMAPEQTQQLANLGPLVDVYALGAVFYESLTGRPPFRGADMADTLLLVRSQLPIAPRTIQPNIPKDLETICLRCLEKEPHRRYKSAAALAEDLERWLDGRPILARPTPIWVAAWKWARRKPAVAAALAIAQVALLAITLSTLYYSKKLQTALQAADASERRAAANAQTTMEALKTLVFDVQNELKKSPQTRPLRNRILESALKGLDRVAKQNENEEPQIVRAQALMQMGTIFAVLGQRDKALEALTGARKTADAVLKLQPNDNVARLAWAEATRVMGHNLLVQSKPEEARKFFDELVERTTSWNRGHSLSGELRWTHLLAFELQGSAAQWIHDFDTAEKCFSAMLAEAQRWAAADSAALAPRAGIARATHLQAALARDRGNLAQAERLFAQSLDGYQDVVKADPANGTYKAGIIINLFNLASLAWDRRDFATARDFIQRALAMHRDRAKIDPDSVDIALEVVETLFMAGRIELDDGRVDRALPLLEEAQQLLEALDQAGKIANRPVYQVERRQQIAAALDKCKEK